MHREGVVCERGAAAVEDVTWGSTRVHHVT